MLLCRAGKPRTGSAQEGTEIPASVKWIQGSSPEQGSKFSSGEQAQLKPNPIFGPLSEGQALQQGPALLLLVKHAEWFSYYILRIPPNTEQFNKSTAGFNLTKLGRSF